MGLNIWNFIEINSYLCSWSRILQQCLRRASQIKLAVEIVYCKKLWIDKKKMVLFCNLCFEQKNPPCWKFTNHRILKLMSAKINWICKTQFRVETVVKDLRSVWNWQKMFLTRLAILVCDGTVFAKLKIWDLKEKNRCRLTSDAIMTCKSYSLDLR